MKRKSIMTILTVAFGCFCVFALIAGCDQTAVKRCRLIADENRQLKKEMEQLNKEAEQLNKELERQNGEIKKQKEQLKSCLEGRKSLEEASQKAFSKDINDIAGLIMEENAALRKEIENLKSQIAEPNKQPESKPSQ